VSLIRLAALTVTIALGIGLSARHFAPPIEYESEREGELIVVRPTAGFATKYRSGPFRHLVKTTDGVQWEAYFGRILSPNERVRAKYAPRKGVRTMKILAYVRCGSSPCVAKRHSGPTTISAPATPRP
jgi:hypothetical protein